MFSFDLFKYILAKQHLGCRLGLAGTMADECITPYSKIVPWTPTSLVEMSRGLSQEVLQEKKNNLVGSNVQRHVLCTNQPAKLSFYSMMLMMPRM